MAAAAIALAACSGGGGLNEDESAGLHQELKEAKAQAATDAAARLTAEAKAVAAQAAKVTAEAKAEVARTAQVAAETARRLAVETAAGQVSDAEADVETAQKVAKDALDAKAKADAALIVAQDKQKKAEDERDAAVLAEEEAQRQLRLALQATTAEELRRQQAEAEQDRLAQVAEDAEQLANQGAAREVLRGLGGLAEANPSIITPPLDNEANNPAVTPRYRAAAGVSGTPGVTFVNPTTGSQGRWFRTAFSNTGGQFVDRMDVYSDAEAPARIDFKDSTYNSGNNIVNVQGDVIGAHTIVADDGVHTAASAFPRTSTVPDRKTLVHRGMNSSEFEDALTDQFSDLDGGDGVFDSSERNTQAFRDALVAAGITSSQFSQYIGVGP